MVLFVIIDSENSNNLINNAPEIVFTVKNKAVISSLLIHYTETYEEIPWQKGKMSGLDNLITKRSSMLRTALIRDEMLIVIPAGSSIGVDWLNVFVRPKSQFYEHRPTSSYNILSSSAYTPGMKRT